MSRFRTTGLSLSLSDFFLFSLDSFFIVVVVVVDAVVVVAVDVDGTVEDEVVDVEAVANGSVTVVAAVPEDEGVVDLCDFSFGSLGSRRGDSDTLTTVADGASIAVGFLNSAESILGVNCTESMSSRVYRDGELLAELNSENLRRKNEKVLKM